MKRISVKGYKAINNEKELDLAPINLLIGANGSGKSTFINSLVLAKGMFNVKFSNDYENINVYPKSIYSYDFSDRLINPFDNIGKFSSSDINNHKKNKEFSFMLPIELSHFADKFNIELKYYLNENNIALLNGIRIINLTNKKELFSLQSDNLEEIAREKENGKNSNDLTIFDSIIKIDVDYLLNFLKEYEPVIPGNLPNSIADSISDLDEYCKSLGLNYKEVIEENERDNREFIKKNITDFDKTEKCTLSNFKNSINGASTLDLIDKYKDVENQGFFNFYSTKSDAIEHEKLNISENKELHAISIELENKLLKTLKTGIRKTWSGNNIASIIDCFDSANHDLFSQRITSSNHEGLLEQRLKKINVTKKYSVKKDIVFNLLLIKNIFDAIIKLNIEINNLIYIPPNRVKNYKFLYSNLNEDVTTTFIKRLNNIQYQNIYDIPIEHFISYWLAELKLDKKLNIKKIEDLISFYSSNGSLGQRVNQDLGYGIGQLFPLICLLSLYNERFSLTNADRNINFEENEPTYEDIFFSDTNSRSGHGNCFLIEEPEANLHPNYQSRLADIFIDAAWKFGHQFVIETHSEYMVRKFQYWVAKGKIKPSDINIYYFENKNDDPLIKDLIIKKIEINLDGSLSEPFGEGFFDEAINWKFELLKLKNSQKN